MRSFGCAECAKSLLANVAFADIGVAVDARAQRLLGNRWRGSAEPVSSPKRCSMWRNRGFQSRRFAMSKPGGQQMAGVEAIADGQRCELARQQITNRPQLFQTCRRSARPPRRVLQQHRQPPRFRTAERLPHNQAKGRDALSQRTWPLVLPGWPPQVVCANGTAARVQFAAESVDRIFANLRVEHRPDHQVVGVDRQRLQVKALASLCRSSIWLDGRDGPPHARAGGKIWKVLAPRPAAMTAAFSRDLDREVWMPIRTFSW